MALIRNSTLTSGRRLKRGRPLKRIGPKAELWSKFRNAKFKKDSNVSGEITCQDYKLGLSKCGVSTSHVDLHHIIGREERPDLYFQEENLVWLTRDCHERAHQNAKSNHSNTRSTRPQATYDPIRRVERPTRSIMVLPVQRRAEEPRTRRSGRTIYSSVSRRYAPVVEREKEAGI